MNYQIQHETFIIRTGSHAFAVVRLDEVRNETTIDLIDDVRPLLRAFWRGANDATIRAALARRAGRRFRTLADIAEHYDWTMDEVRAARANTRAHNWS